MSNDKLFNIDIIAPNSNDVKFLGKVTKLNIFEFSGSTEFEQDGFFSTKIFGPVGSSARNESLGYMDIGIPILHPKVYQNFMALGTNIVDIILGKSRAIFKNGDFIPDDAGSTGLYFFLKHWPDMKISDNDSDQRKAMIDLNKAYSTKEWLTQYILILPAGMRDYTVKNGKPSEDEINNLYRSLLSIGMTLKNNNINVNSGDVELFNSIIISLQEKFVDVYDYIKNILDGKTGYMQNQFSKHGVKYGNRNVITSTNTIVTNLKDANKLKATDTIIGLHQYMAGISPAAKGEINKLISNVLSSDTNRAYLYNPKTLKPELTEVKYKEINTWTTFEGLDKVIKKFGQDDIKVLPVKLSGKYLGLVRDDSKNIELFFNTEVEDLTNVRPLTYFEFIYIALYDVRDKFPGVITRFPVESMTSSYFTTYYLKTTTDDRDVNFTFNGETKEMVNYPILSSTAYNSLTPHFIRLKGMGGDNDGDTVSNLIIFITDSVNEVHNMLKDIKYYIKPDGSLMNNPYIPPSDLLLKHLTSTFNQNFILLEAQDLIASMGENNFKNAFKNIYKGDVEIDKLLEESEILFHIDENEKIKSYVVFKHLNRYLSDKVYKKYGDASRSDYYTLIEDIWGKGDDLIVLVNKLLEEDYPGYDTISLKSVSELSSLGFKDLKDYSIRFAI